MGYTHYWKQDKTLELSTDQDILIDYVLKDHKDLLDPVDGPDFTSKDHAIFLNGIGELNHETFAVSKDPQEFEFCKTARKPYDIVVCKLILILSLSDGFTFSSDGIWTDDDEKQQVDEEWKEPLEWMKKRGFDQEKLFKDGLK